MEVATGGGGRESNFLQQERWVRARELIDNKAAGVYASVHACSLGSFSRDD